MGSAHLIKKGVDKIFGIIIAEKKKMSNFVP